MCISKFAVALGMAIFSSGHVYAEVIYQSGSFGETGISWQALLDEIVFSTGVESNVFSGVRFEIEKPILVTKIGGHFIGHPLNPSNGFFGALIQLENKTDFPDSGNLSTADVLGVTTITFPETSGVVFGDLTAMLDPGWYAMVFGSGLFGTSAVGSAIRNGIDDGLQSYIAWQPGVGWFEMSSSFVNHYFVVEGHIIPEPSTISLLGTCGIVLLLKHRRMIREQ